MEQKKSNDGAFLIIGLLVIVFIAFFFITRLG